MHPVVDCSSGVHEEAAEKRRTDLQHLPSTEVCALTACRQPRGGEPNTICRECWAVVYKDVKNEVSEHKPSQPKDRDVYYHAACSDPNCRRRVHSRHALTGSELCGACLTTASSPSTRDPCSVCYQSSTCASRESDGRCSACHAADRWTVEALPDEIQDTAHTCSQCTTKFFIVWKWEGASVTCGPCSAQDVTHTLHRSCFGCSKVYTRDFGRDAKRFNVYKNWYLYDKSSYACDDCRRRVYQKLLRETTRTVLESANYSRHDHRYPDRSNYVSVKGLLLRACASCAAESTGHRVCACLTVAYCNMTCQRRDWYYHGMTCSAKKVRSSGVP